jgi:hypothetical protein
MKRLLVVFALLATAFPFFNTSSAGTDTMVGIKFIFNSEGYQGFGGVLGWNEIEMHGSWLNNIDYAIGLGYRFDTEGRGMKNDKRVSASATLGLSYVGGDDSGVRPFGQGNVELDADRGVSVNVGAISYGLGLGLTSTDNFGYYGVAYEDLHDNRPATINPPAQMTDSGVPTEPTNPGDDDGSDDDDGPGGSGSDGDDGPGGPADDADDAGDGSCVAHGGSGNCGNGNGNGGGNGTGNEGLGKGPGNGQGNGHSNNPV